MHTYTSEVDPISPPLWDMATANQTGDFTLANIPDGHAYALAGLPFFGDEKTGLGYIVKTGLVISGSTATKTRIKKGTYFTSGDIISGSVGSVAVAITSIDKTNDEYDVLNHATVGTPYAIDKVVFEASTAGSSSAYKYDATGLLNDNTKNVDSPSCTQVVRALRVIESNLPTPLTDKIKEDLTDRIRYSTL